MTEALAPGATIGILGGGQLGRMLSVAASRLGYRCHIFEPGAAPAADDGGHREDLADQIGPAGRRVVVGGVVECLDRDGQGGVGVQVPPVQLFQRRLGEHRPGADGVVTEVLVVAPAGGVVGDDPAGLRRVGGMALLRQAGLEPQPLAARGGVGGEGVGGAR